MIESAEEFIRLATSEVMEEYLRAAREDAPEHVWLDVIERYPNFRDSVAHNKTVPRSILLLLAKDENERVRWTVASRRAAGEEILKLLIKDPSSSVRSEVVLNRKAPLWILEEGIKDSEPLVARYARQRLEERKLEKK